MPTERSAAYFHDGPKLPVEPGVILGRKPGAAPLRIRYPERTERVEIGHENIRNEAFAELLSAIRSEFGDIIEAKALNRKIARIIADFAMAVLEEDRKIDSSIPVNASLDGYREALKKAGKVAKAEVKRTFDRFWESHEGGVGMNVT